MLRMKPLRCAHQIVGHGRDYYLTWPLFLYLDENPDGLSDLGEGTVVDLWQQPLAGEYPLMTLERLTPASSLKTIVGGYVVWHKEDPELIAEVANVRHRDDQGAAPEMWSHAYYIQGAYRLPWNNRLWKPYARFEHVGVNPGDVVFASVPNVDQALVGLRYDASQFAAIKGEFRTWTRGPDSQRNYGGFFQISFTF